MPRKIKKHSFCKQIKGRNFHKVKSFALKMRDKPTKAESAFLVAINKLRPLTGHISPQHHFIGKRNAFILDVYLTEKQIGFEIDGGYHNSTTQQAKDKFKDNYCRSYGVKIVRLTNQQALNEWECQLIILKAIKAPQDVIKAHEESRKNHRLIKRQGNGQ